MRNFHRDFESLNEAYTSQIQSKCECTINESVTDDIALKHRDGSIKALKEALRALARAHHEDYSNVTMEDVYSEMKIFAEENLPTQPGINVPTGPDSPIHNPSPMGISTEGTDGKTDDLTEREKQKLSADAAKRGKGPTNDKSSDEDDEETIGSRGVDESSSGNIHAALKDDEDADHYEKTGEIRKKKKTEDDTDEKTDVGENFENMLDILKLTDQHHPMNGQVVEEEMYDCIRDYMETDGMSYAQAKAECSGRGYEESANGEDVTESGAAQLGGLAGQKDAAYKKGLDAAFDIQAKVSSERNPIKRAMMSKDAKKVTRGVNKYMTALTGKLVDMTRDLK